MLPRTAARLALSRLAHRGPDDHDEWRDERVWLGHRRLSVIDLSAAGRQPMASACGRFMLVCNGEIYNHRELRRDLDARRRIAWRGHSDTEVLVESIAAFGIEATLRRLNGMFALAVWDRELKRTYLARDPFGEKPLYYSLQDGALAFASELGALEALASRPHSLSRAALWLFLKYGYVPAPHTIYADVFKLAPGTLLSWTAGQPPRTQPYWSLDDTIAQARLNSPGDEEEAVERLDALLKDAVGLRMAADVPLGAFLSGGIDSSLVTALMQAQSAKPVKTYTAGFESPEFNEAGHAAAVARHLGTDHTELIVTMADAQEVVPRLGQIFDEPFADISQIPTFLVSRMARAHVTVCLTGDGGDELFGGYVRYSGVPRLWRGLRRLPLRNLLAAAIDHAPPKLLEGVFGALGPSMRQFSAKGALWLSLKKASAWTPATSQDDLYERTMSAWVNPNDILLSGDGAPPCGRVSPAFEDLVDGHIWRDTMDYLPDDILCKVDRTAMANSLETRVPLLDTRVAAFAWSLPMDLKIRGGQGKWLLRRVLERHVPRALWDRPKMGFTAPLHGWLSGDLRDWAEDLLSVETIRRQGLFKPAALQRLWRRYLRGDVSVEARLWTVLMFQAWLGARSP